MKSLFILATLLVNSSSLSFSQAAWTEFSTANSPLPDNSVRCITFENDSTAWIGTDFGLAKLVNGQWTLFTTANSGITSNSIRSMAIDKNGVKWIGTFANGLCSYNDTVWTSISTLNSPLPDDYIRSLAIDTNNVMWVGTSGGLVRIDSLTTFRIYDQFNSILNSNNMAAIKVDPSNNNKWVGTINGGLILIDKDTNFTEFITQNSGIADNTVLGIDVDGLGNVFMASPANGLMVKLSGFGWFTYNQLSSNIPTPALNCIKLDLADQPWIGTVDKGILFKNGNNFIYYDTSNSPLTDVMIQCVNIDDSGKVWMGTQIGGLFVLDPALLTGVTEVSTLDNVHVYPNPAHDFLYFSASHPAVKIDIIDISGRFLTGFNTTKNSLDVSGLKSGIYQLRLVFADGNSVVKKFIKE